MVMTPRRLALWTGLLLLVLVPALAGAATPAGTETDTVQKPAPSEEPEKAKKGEKAKEEKAEAEETKGGEKKDGEPAEGEKAEGEKTEGEKKDGEKAEGEKADAEGADKDKVGTFEDIWSPGFVVKGAERLFVALLEKSGS